MPAHIPTHATGRAAHVMCRVMAASVSLPICAVPMVPALLVEETRAAAPVPVGTLIRATGRSHVATRVLGPVGVTNVHYETEATRGLEGAVCQHMWWSISRC